MSRPLDAPSEPEPGGLQRAADSLAFAASPVFAAMALLAASPSDMLCSMAANDPWSGMTTMYLLMSAAHLPPWLRLFSRVRSGFSRT